MSVERFWDDGDEAWAPVDRTYIRRHTPTAITLIDTGQQPRADRPPRALRALPDTTWMDDAACRGKRTADWFPEATVPNAIKEACEACPVREPCLAYAVRYRESGVWGGTSEKQRQSAARRQRKRELDARREMEGR